MYVPEELFSSNFYIRLRNNYNVDSLNNYIR